MKNPSPQIRILIHSLKYVSFVLQLAKAMKNDSEKCDWVPDLSDAVETPRLLLVCGGDLLETFSTPGLWQEEDVRV